MDCVCLRRNGYLVADKKLFVPDTKGMLSKKKIRCSSSVFDVQRQKKIQTLYLYTYYYTSRVQYMMADLYTVYTVCNV